MSIKYQAVSNKLAAIKTLTAYCSTLTAKTGGSF